MSSEWNIGRKNIPARFGKSTNGSKISRNIWQVYQSKLKIFLAVTHKKLQFKGTELDLNGTELAENLKLPNLLPTAICPLLLHDLGYLKRALKQLKRCREEHILARVLTIENHP